MKIVINLSPGDIKKSGSHFDLAMAIEAQNRGINNLIIPKENIREASLVKGINIFGFEKLTEVTSFLEGVNPYNCLEDLKCDHVIKRPYLYDFQDVQGQDAIIQFIVASAAGGHNLIMSGAPGCCKSMIVKRIPSILLSMTEKEALEVTKIYSVLGGSNAMPGEISLAHNGVLFLDEIAEFNKKTLDALRQPMEDNKVTISN